MKYLKILIILIFVFAFMNINLASSETDIVKNNSIRITAIHSAGVANVNGMSASVKPENIKGVAFSVNKAINYLNFANLTTGAVNQPVNFQNKR